MRLFIVPMMPDELIKEWHGSQAGNNFCRNLINGRIFDQVISLVQINVTEDIRKQTEDIPEIDKAIQCRKFPHHGFGYLLNVIIENLILVRMVRTFESIWFYNVTRHTFLSFLLLWLLHKKIFMILADYNPPKNWHDFGAQIIYFAIKRAKGIISLSDRTGISHSCLKVIPGIIPNEQIVIPKQEELIPRFLFSGSLSKMTGIDLAVEAFVKANDLPLTITGATKDDSRLRAAVQNSPNIDYKGQLHFQQYLSVLHSHAWALSFRNPNIPANAFNFPSKILEYLACGKIVLSTMHYKELEGIRYFYSDFDPNKVRDVAHRIMMLSESEQKEIREHNAKELKRFFVSEWKKNIENIEQ